MRARFIDRIGTVSACDWNAALKSDYPFLRHEFLFALEASGSVDERSGWTPCHLLVEDDQRRLVAIMPNYLKAHSWGEYVFDWAWARAYQQHGLEYYPKFVAGIPFTPATGPRLAIASTADPQQVAALALSAIRDRQQVSGGSSWHLLFPDHATRQAFAGENLLLRQGIQYHWHNDGYRDFDDFLSAMTARRRKAIRRERRAVAEQGVEVTCLTGRDIDASAWRQFYAFYQLTYARRSGHGGYLEPAFFDQVGASMPEHIVMVVANRSGRMIAAALNFRDSSTLFGRYWGCTESVSGLHFEACYYQGIDYCIRHGLTTFDAGAQGEHKIQRGFEPVLTDSLHDIAHPGFKRAIADFLREEATAIRDWQREAQALLPFRRESGEIN